MSEYKLCPVCAGSGLTFGNTVDQPCSRCSGSGGVLHCYETFDCRNGTHSDACPASEPTAESFAEQFGDKPVCDVDVVTCEYQFPDEQPEPTYTMQQAIARIVDGVVLEWEEFKPNWFKARTEFCEYGVWRSGSSIYCGEETEDASSMVATSFDDGKRKMLELHKSRFRAEIERTVNRGS